MRPHRSIVFPFNSIERQPMSSMEKSQRNRKIISHRKTSSQLFNFKPSRHRSVHHMNDWIDPGKTVKKDDFLPGFVKEGKIGKGGFSVVW